MSSNTRRRVTPDVGREFARLYDEGYAFAAIGRAAGGYHKETVRKWLVRNGHHVPVQRCWLSDKDSRGVADWYVRGVLVDNIGRRFGISSSNVYWHVRKHGIPLRQPRRPMGAEGQRAQ